VSDRVTPDGAPLDVTENGPPFGEVMVRFAVADVPSCEIVRVDGVTVAETGVGRMTDPPPPPPHPVNTSRNKTNKLITSRI
jgi:hypothetical protein